MESLSGRGPAQPNRVTLYMLSSLKGSVVAANAHVADYGLPPNASWPPILASPTMVCRRMQRGHGARCYPECPRATPAASSAQYAAYACSTPSRSPTCGCHPSERSTELSTSFRGVPSG